MNVFQQEAVLSLHSPRASYISVLVTLDTWQGGFLNRKVVAETRFKREV